MYPAVLGGTDRFDAFVARALEKNIGEICVTDHMPLSISRAPDRIEAGRVGEYSPRTSELAEKKSGSGACDRRIAVSKYLLIEGIK